MTSEDRAATPSGGAVVTFDRDDESEREYVESVGGHYDSLLTHTRSTSRFPRKATPPWHHCSRQAAMPSRSSPPTSEARSTSSAHAV
jgi:hypothetical protein